MARTASSQPGHGEEQLHAPDADEGERLGDAHLVVDGEGDVGALLAVAHRDVVQLDLVIGHAHRGVEVVRAAEPVLALPGTGRVFHSGCTVAPPAGAVKPAGSLRHRVVELQPHDERLVGDLVDRAGR